MIALKVLYYSCDPNWNTLIWYSTYRRHVDEVERIQRPFLRYIYFRTYGVYPEPEPANALLLDWFDFQSIQKDTSLRFSQPYKN